MKPTLAGVGCLCALALHLEEDKMRKKQTTTGKGTEKREKRRNTRHHLRSGMMGLTLRLLLLWDCLTLGELPLPVRVAV